MNNEPYTDRSFSNNVGIPPLSLMYRVNVVRVLASLIIFYLYYLIHVFLAIILLIACSYAGYKIISINVSYITLLLSLGIIGTGLMFFIFLIKFFFSVNKDHNPFQQEIIESDQPILFQFIRKLTNELKTKFPQKIYFTHDVNAAVFYNPGFLSMFIPTRKNLEIGLGLVNSLNISEFKAVLGHEFGHFSQKSMKVSSYIYGVNKAIFNMVYEQDSWDNILNSWAASHGIFGIFARITFELVELVRSSLKSAYNIVNRNYLRLSQEMEFHADLVSASVAGSGQAECALKKTDFSASAYDYLITVLNSFLDKNCRTENIFKNHSKIMSMMAEKYGLKMVEGTPVITDEDIEKNLIKSRINIKNQWTSHPPTSERISNLRKFNSESELITLSAWNLFTNVENLQTDTTKYLFSIIKPEKNLTILKESEFDNHLLNEEKKYHLSALFNGFYDERYFETFDIEDLIQNSCFEHLKFEEVYTKENAMKFKKYKSNKLDLELLTAIYEQKIKLKYFEFDNKKFKAKVSASLIKNLAEEINLQKRELKELEQKSFMLNYKLAKLNKAETLYTEKYKNVISVQQIMQKMEKFVSRFENLRNELYSKLRWRRGPLQHMTDKIFDFEKEFEDYLGTINFDKYKSGYIGNKELYLLKKYMSSDQYYFDISDFNEKKFELLANIVYSASSYFGNAFIVSVKNLSDLQLDFYSKESDGN